MRNAVVVVAATAVMLTACSSSSSPSSTSTSAAPATVTVTATPSTAPSPSSTSAAVLTQGQSATVYPEASGGNQQKATANVTVDAVKITTKVPGQVLGGTATASPGDHYLFVQLTIKNTGQLPVDPSSFSGVIGASWVSGNTVYSPSLQIGVDPSALGLKKQDLSGLPTLQPGQQGTGTASLSVPTDSGTLTLNNPDGTTLLKVQAP